MKKFFKKAVALLLCVLMLPALPVTNVSGLSQKEFDKAMENNENIIKDKKSGENQMNVITIKINGLMCPHCSGRVKSLLEESEFVASADVSHERGDAIVELSEKAGGDAVSVLKEIINSAGYTTP